MRQRDQDDYDDYAYEPDYYEPEYIPPRKRKVSTALKAYAALATSAAKGAVRAID